MLALWDEDIPLADRVQRFADALPRELPTPGSRVEIASFLLLADPTEYAMYRPTPIKTAAALVDYPSFPDEPESAIYSHALAFLDDFIAEAGARGLELRDRLDAQSVVWALTKTEPDHLSGWSDSGVEAFLRYRGERPSIWWVNQGESYDTERDRGLVQARLRNKAGYDLQHWKNIELLRKGDVILHHVDGHMRAISEVSSKPGVGARSWLDDAEGRWANTKYFELVEPIEVRDIDSERRVAEPGPFDKYGGVKQVYLSPLSVDFSDWLRTA